MASFGPPIPGAPWTRLMPRPPASGADAGTPGQTGSTAAGGGGGRSANAGHDKPFVERVPNPADGQRLRRHTEKVSEVLNSLMAQGLLVQTAPGAWSLAGVAGATGPQGPAGATGAAGAPGPAGANGADGAGALPSGTPVVLGDLTWVNQSTATAAATATGLWVYSPAGSSGLQCLVKSKSSPATLTVWLLPCFNGVGNSGAGLVVRDSATGKLVLWSVQASITSAHKGVFNIDYWTNATTFSSQPLVVDYPPVGAPIRALRVQDDGTNFKFSYSADGLNFLAVTSLSRTAFLASPDQWGLAGFNGNATYDSAATFLGLDVS